MKDFTKYKRDSLANKGISKGLSKDNMVYEEALSRVEEFIKEALIEKEIDKSSGLKDKTYLEETRARYTEMVRTFLVQKKVSVIGLSNSEFIEKAVEDIVGYSVLKEAFDDPKISDIYVISWDKIFVEKSGKNERYAHNFRNEKHCDDTLRRFLNIAGKELNEGDRKIVNFELFGDRGAAIAKIVATKGISCTFRKHGQVKVSVEDMLSADVLTGDMADLIGVFLEGELNMIYAGLTGSGKTTSVKALINKYVLDKRILVAEDTQELFLENEHTLELLSFKGSNESANVSLNDLILLSLRLKPRTIVVGEVRGMEAQAAVEAMETGHSTIFTMHGGQPINVINRLVTKYLTAMPSLGIDVVERIIGSAVDYICIQDNIPNIGRKVTAIVEVDYDFDSKRVALKPIYEYDIEKKKFIQVGRIGDTKVKTMLRRGVNIENLSRWIDR